MQQPGLWINQSERLLDDEGEPLWHEHPTLKNRADFVALPLSALEHVQLYPIEIATDTIAPGDDRIAVWPTSIVSVVGFPFGVATNASIALWATGFVASEPDFDHGEGPIFLIDCRTRPGQSGSPVLAFRAPGELVALENRESAMFETPVWRFMGIYSGRINDGSDLGKVWKRSALLQLVQTL
jgi:hypothetical protein